MKVYNYSCNDEIYRKSCILSWDVENDSYKIGKHKVPSLDDVIEAIIHKRSKNKDRKNRLLFSLRKFLHSGTKTTGDDLDDVEKTFGIAESENYAHTLKPFINENGYYKIDFSDLREKASNPKNKLLILCSPHNPVGRVWTKEELEEIVKICEETNTYILSDEIHCDLTRKNIHKDPLNKIFNIFQ